MNKRTRRRVARALFALLSALGVPAAFAQRDELAFARAEHLRHGVNTSLWFAQMPGHYTPERLRSFTTEEDLKLIASLGLDHIRLSVDPEPLEEWLRAGHSPFLDEVDRVVHAANADGLAVVVDLHPQSEYKARLFAGEDAVEHYAALWRALATHFRATDPKLVFFEVMNEPEQTDPFRWEGVQAHVAAAIREAAPDHTIVATGAQWSGLNNLLELGPLSLRNVIYTFHDYEPFPFTHQGATWTSPEVAPLRGVPYPSSPELIDPLLKQEPSLASQWKLEQYGLDRWDADRVARTLSFAARWGKQFGVPVYCGEFGVLRDYAPPAMRAAWTRDMRLALEANGIGWAMWDYQANFGLVRKPAGGGEAVPDPALVDALGLRLPATPAHALQ